MSTYAHVDASDRTVQDEAIDAFLGGIHNKKAAEKAMNMNPRSIQQAVEYVDMAQHTRLAVYSNSKGYSSSHLKIVSLADHESESDEWSDSQIDEGEDD